MKSLDEKYMKEAIEIAKLGLGFTKTNPVVGSIIVKNNKIISKGYHEYFAGAHAEENAINNSLESVENSTLYVTLEPCSHFGKRGPCCDLIIKNKIKRVVIGSKDLNKKVNSIEKLKNAGIEVTNYVLKEECDKLNKVFFHSIGNKKPYVIFKSAITLDGKIASKDGNSKWISSEKSRNLSRKLRGKVDAILVGINTVIKDNPKLNTRIRNLEDPIRVVVDSSLKIPLDSNILNLESKSKTYIFTTKYFDTRKYEELKNNNMVKVFIVNDINKKVDLEEMLRVLYKENIGSVLLEGGGTLAYSMFEKKLINRVIYFIAPKIIGGKNALTSVEGKGISKISNSFNINFKQIKRINKDLLLIGDVDYVYRNN